MPNNEALVKKVRANIQQLCSMVNTLAGADKVNENDFLESLALLEEQLACKQQQQDISAVMVVSEGTVQETSTLIG